MSENTDRQLVQACLAGNTKAFGKLIEIYQKPLFNLAFRLTRVLEDAEDIVQSVFVKAYERLDSYDPNYKFFSWIYRMTVNETINFIKQQRHLELLDDSHIDAGRNPEQEFRVKELSREIDEVLIGLSLDYRVVIVLRHFADLPYAEIAQVLEVPEKTVKSRLFTARQIMCRELQRRGVTADD